MPACIFADEAESTCRRRNQNHEKRCEPCGDKVCAVVEDTCGKPSKIFVPVAFIADHRVQCVYHFVCHHQRNSASGVEKQRCDYAVAQVFGKRFERGGTDLLERELRRVAPYNPAQLFAGSGQIVFLHLAFHLQCFGNQASVAEGVEKQQGI
ncbi:hypothetical protein SDC9_136468 [bioreactor metagenome]|uniref:Uncharacterized protein n=1 Tax=bioreactor metagenome TaxID=1076179 RepID=A0A645DJ71_9ZZZZ